MVFQPDIVVLDSNHSRFLLVVEVENGKKADPAACEEEMKHYMESMNVPTGILVTPSVFGFSATPMICTRRKLSQKLQTFLLRP